MKNKILLSISFIALLFFGYWIFEMNPIPKGVNLDSENKHTPIETTLQSGDIIFQTSTSSQSKAIQLATHSKYSHVGIIYKVDEDLFVLEAVQPVKITPFKIWVSRGDNNHYVVKRLKNADKILTKEVINEMKQIGNRFIGKNYDLYFEWSDDRIYCSELVWKIYQEGAGLEIGELQELAEFDLSNATVKKKIKERYGNQIPVHEKVISPGAMFDSELLVEIGRN